MSSTYIHITTIFRNIKFIIYPSRNLLNYHKKRFSKLQHSRTTAFGYIAICISDFLWNDKYNCQLVSTLVRKIKTFYESTRTISQSINSRQLNLISLGKPVPTGSGSLSSSICILFVMLIPIPNLMLATEYESDCN